MNKDQIPEVVIHGRVNPLMASQLTDAQVASMVYMHTSISPGLLESLLKDSYKGTTVSEDIALVMGISQIARDRILYLSQRLEQAEALLRQFTGDSKGELTENLEETTAFLALPRTIPSIEPDLMKRP